MEKEINRSINAFISQKNILLEKFQNTNLQLNERNEIIQKINSIDEILEKYYKKLEKSKLYNIIKLYIFIDHIIEKEKDTSLEKNIEKQELKRKTSDNSNTSRIKNNNDKYDESKYYNSKEKKRTIKKTFRRT